MKNRFAVFAALCGLFVLLRATPEAIASCRYGLRLCTELILPSLFPFFVLSGLLGRLGFPARAARLLSPVAGRLFHVSGAGLTALLLGLTGGYPMGAAYLGELMRGGAVSEDEGGRLLAFCNNSGPAFLVGAVGSGVFGSSALGLKLYGIHALAAVLTGLLLRGRAMPPAGAPARADAAQPFPEALTEAVRQAAAALLNVCGFVVCFSVFTGLLEANGFFGALLPLLARLLPLEEAALRALLCGFFELGGGIGALRGLPPTPLHLALAAGLVGWGGLSVQFQSLAVLAELRIKSAPLVAGRVLSAVFSFFLALLVFRI